ncbi:MAG TPA: chromate efflux transporter [Actinomycetota bacterium]|nr:chromate efflux transporter [Actinomycetota bacterium]
MSERRARLLEVARLFTRLGFTAFGGPAAHTAMMHDEVVTRRGWLSEREFLDLIAATNMIPGPNSTELAIHLGRRRGGVAGLVIAGACFIVPAMAIVLALAWAYVGYGSTPEGRALLYGIGPVIITIVAQALWKLTRAAVTGPFLAALGLVALVLYFLGVNELVLIFGGGALVMVARNARSLGWAATIAPWLSPVPLAAALPAVMEPTAVRLFLTFLKIGAVLYGSGYVLLAFLRADFVERLGWLTQRQLIDAVAIGQFTPGPLFTTATFVGYVVLGLPGALLATGAIFLPSFVFVAATAPLIPRMRASRWFGALLDGATVAALALMAGVTWQLGVEAIVDVPAAAIAVLAAAALFLWRPNSFWLVLAGGVAGLAIEALR